MQVNGTIYNGITGETLPQATIYKVGNFGAMPIAASDNNGGFSVTLYQGEKIQVSYIGFKTLVLDPKSQMKIDMAVDEQSLEAVTILGYKKPKKNSYKVLIISIILILVIAAIAYMYFKKK